MSLLLTLVVFYLIASLIIYLSCSLEGLLTFGASSEPSYRFDSDGFSPSLWSLWLLVTLPITVFAVMYSGGYVMPHYASIAMLVSFVLSLDALSHLHIVTKTRWWYLIISLIKLFPFSILVSALEAVHQSEIISIIIFINYLAIEYGRLCLAYAANGVDSYYLNTWEKLDNNLTHGIYAFVTSVSIILLAAVAGNALAVGDTEQIWRGLIAMLVLSKTLHIWMCSNPEISKSAYGHNSVTRSFYGTTCILEIVGVIILSVVMFAEGG